MSGIELKPISESAVGRSNFLLPLGKTVLGRGPVLGVSDKRVSRNHGLVEVEDGKVKIMSTHTNPTFYQAKGTSKLLPLPKEVWQILEHGDRIALTPDQHVYEVVIDERPYHKSSQSLGSSLTGSPVKDSPKKPQLKQTEDSEENRGLQENNRKENSTGADEKNWLNNSNGVSKQTPTDEENKNKRDSSKDDEKEEAGANQDDEHPLTQTQNKAGTTVTLPGQKEIALPLEKERKLPDWMAQLGGGSLSAAKDTAAQAGAGRGRGRGRVKGYSATPGATPKPATPKRSKKQPCVSSDEASDQEYAPAVVKRNPSKGRVRHRGRGKGRGRGRGRPQQHPSDDEDEEEAEEEEGIRAEVEEEEEEEAEAVVEEEGPKRWGHGKTRDQAAVKRKAKLAMDYSEEFLPSEHDEEDEDEELPVPEGDDGSDWEPESHSPRLMRTPSKGRRTPGRTPGRTSGRRGGRRYSRRSSDEESDLSEEEVYIPRPTKRSGRSISSSLEIDSQDMPRKRSRKTGNGKKTREPCQFGRKCYRKNPQHKEEFAHPGDSDYESERSDDDVNDSDDDDDEKKDCPYGTNCYRKNKRHLEQYKHSKAPGRPKRQAARKRATLADGDSDDDGEVNTYDYGDSFIDDGTQATDKASDPDSEDWTPGPKDDD